MYDDKLTWQENLKRSRMGSSFDIALNEEVRRINDTTEDEEYQRMVREHADDPLRCDSGDVLRSPRGHHLHLTRRNDRPKAESARL